MNETKSVPRGTVPQRSSTRAKRVVSYERIFKRRDEVVPAPFLNKNFKEHAVPSLNKYLEGTAPSLSFLREGAVTVPRPRAKVTEGRTEKVETPRGPIYVTVNEDELGLCEVFVESLDAEAETIGRLSSLLLRAGVDPRKVVEELWHVQSREIVFDKSVEGEIIQITTVAQGMAIVICRYLYGDGFDPKKNFPRASTLPEPTRR